jgi:hypothetical protein
MRQSKQFGGIFELHACRNATPLVRCRRGPTQPRRQAFHSDFQQRNFTSGDPHHSGFAGRSLSVSKLAIRQVRVSIFHINNYIPQRRKAACHLKPVSPSLLQSNRQNTQRRFIRASDRPG